MPRGRFTMTSTIATTVVSARRIRVFIAIGRLTFVVPKEFSRDAVDITRRMFTSPEAEADQGA